MTREGRQATAMIQIFLDCNIIFINNKYKHRQGHSNSAIYNEKTLSQPLQAKITALKELVRSSDTKQQKVKDIEKVKNIAQTLKALKVRRKEGKPEKNPNFSF